MSQMPGDNPIPSTQAPLPIPDDDIPMFNPPNNIPDPAQSQSMTDGEFGRAILQELIQSRRSQEQTVQRLLAEREIAATRPAAPGESLGSKKLAADPNPFDGTSGKLEEFLSDLRLCFLADGRFNTAQKQIIYALSYMKGGSAHAWAVNESKREELWATWADFERALRGRFEMGDRMVEAQDALHGLKQRGRPVEEYFDTFKAHRPYSGLNDAACLQLLRHGLDYRLISAIYNQNIVPTTYEGFKELAIRKDRQYREFQGLLNPRTGPRRYGWSAGDRDHHGGGGHEAGGSGGGGGASGGHEKGRFGHSGLQTNDGPYYGSGTPFKQAAAGSPDRMAAHAVGVTPGAGTPMDIDRRRGGHVSAGECFICHENGHFARNCPRCRGGPPHRSLIRGVFLGMPEEERTATLEELRGFASGGEAA